MADNYVTVKIEEGLLRGEKKQSVRGGDFYSFKGIPYAKPPIGDLRFKSPVPPEPWTGIRDALKHAHLSASKKMFREDLDEESSEDCLYLNVYTPSIPQGGNDKPRSVLVWIHGGSFTVGSGNDDIYGPDLLITEDVILVTINYRLGALGFLSLGTTDCPGNWGLKDCVLALKWVQRNISAFGGNPRSVTVFGESAGAGITQLLFLSKSARGLFHKAISQSGTAFDPWSIVKNPRDYAFAMGEKLGCKTNDDKELLECFKKASAKDLVMMETDLFKVIMPDEVIFNMSFMPVVEPDHADAFITKTPKQIFLDGDVADVPYIMGANSEEGLYLHTVHKTLIQSTADEEIQKLIPKSLDIKKGTPQAAKFAEKIRNFYFPNGLTEKRKIDLHSRVWFYNGLVKTSHLITKIKNRKSPTYVYQFSFDGKNNFLKALMQITDEKGAAHGDEVGYLFHGTMMAGGKITPGTPEYVTMERMTKMWTDFAKTGNPTPRENLWKPISEKNIVYLDIGDELEMLENFEEEVNKVWNEIYQLV